MRSPRPREETLRAVIEAMPVGVLVWRADGKLLFANRRATEIAGRPFAPGLEPARMIVSHHLRRAGTAERYPAARLAFRRALAGEMAAFDDIEFELPDGQRRPVEGWAAPVRGADGVVEFAVTIFDDVTDRRSAETLRAGEARILAMVAANMPLAQTLDTMARVVEAQAEGMRASILLIEDGVRVRHAAAPSLPEAWVKAVDYQPIGPNQGSCGTAAYLKQPVIVTDIASDPRWANYRGLAQSFGFRACWAVPIMGPDEEVLGTFALYHTESREPTPRLLGLIHHASHLATVAIQHHRHQEAIVEGEAHARLIVENALDANVLMDNDGVVTGWNPRAATTFGWTAEEAVGRKLSELIIPARLRESHEAGLRRYLATGVGPILGRRLEVSALHKDGHEFLVELAVTPIRRGDRILFSAFIEDISARKQAEEALGESQHHLSLVYDHVDDVLFQIQVEPEGYRFLSVNPAFRAATGLEPDQVIGKLVNEVIPEPSLTLVLARYKEAIEARRTLRWEETTTFATGVRHGDVAVTPVYDAQGKPKYLIGSVRDVTQQKRMEDEVRQLQKLEAIGRLSGGIAHDFNNILSVILGVGNMLLRDTDKPEDRAQVEEILKAGERGAELTRQFLAFGSKQMLQPRVLDLNSVVRDIEKMLRRLIREDITLNTVPTPGLWWVEADPGQIEQVLVNLVVNARDAMPEGGTVTIRTGNIDPDNEFARSRLPGAPREFVELTVSDNGVGMDDATQQRIFEPFFTTKEPGKGTGLGLATVYGIVKQSGGYISVDSAPGKGSAITVFLPRSASEALSPRSAGGARRVSGGRTLADVHVLVVEDEPSLRRTIERMLARVKCRVTTARSGEEALAAVTNGLDPDVVLADIVMPGMSGRVLAQRLREMRPDLRLVQMSGYADLDLAPPGSLDAAGLFLQKPFAMGDLATILEKALSAEAPE